NDFNLQKAAQKNIISFKVEGIEAFKPEDFSPAFSVMAPRVLVASNQFSLEGVETEVENWNDFGKWLYDDLIKDTNP
ncbi:MAG: DUF3857 domain-containing protein, partial [Maioricimonas sp. JB045]